MALRLQCKKCSFNILFQSSSNLRLVYVYDQTSFVFEVFCLQAGGNLQGGQGTCGAGGGGGVVFWCSLSAPLWGASVLHAVSSPQQTVWLSTCSSHWGKGAVASDSEGGKGLSGQRVAFCEVMGEGVCV